MQRLSELLRGTVLGCVALAACLLMSTGCDQTQAAGEKASTKLSPEESFKQILSRVKRTLTESSILMQQEDRTTSFSYHNEITGKVIEPNEEHDTYTARIVIQYKKNFRLENAEQPDEEEPKRASQNILSEDDPDAALLEELTGSGEAGDGDLPLPDILGDDNGTSGGDADDAPQSDRIQVESSRSIEAYDLAYQDGKWVLTSEVEKESMQRLFDYALSRQ